MALQDKSLGLIDRVLQSERGASSIEYALIASIISMAILAGATAIGQSLRNSYNGIASNLT